MKRFFRVLLRSTLYLLLAAGAAAAIAWSFWPQPVPVELAAIGRGSLRVTVDEDGKTRIKERYVVSAPLAGRLLRIELDPGDAVRRGTTQLAVIEPVAPEMLDVRELAQAEAKVQAAEAVLARVEPAMERARAEWEFSESELARIRALVRSKAASNQELEQAQMQYRAREADLRSARFAQDVASFELEMAKAALLHAQPPAAGETARRRFEISSPISGQVLRVHEESETIVQRGMALLELGDPTDLEVEVDVLSVDAVQIAPGTKAFLEQWGGQQPLIATVRLVEPAGFTKISALGVEEQRVNVILDLDDPADRRRTLGDAFRVEARIVIWEQDDVLQVPTGALFRQRDQWAAFVRRDGQAELRIVTIGHRNSLAAEILDGLAEGEQVILHPSDKIADGTSIELRQ